MILMSLLYLSNGGDREALRLDCYHGNCPLPLRVSVAHQRKAVCMLGSSIQLIGSGSLGSKGTSCILIKS